MYFEARYFFSPVRSQLHRFTLKLVCILGFCLFSVFLSLPVCAEEASAEYQSSGIVTEHGQLSISPDGAVTDIHNESFQLQGISTHNLAWYPEYVNVDTLRRLRDDFSINTIRLAMYTAEDGGYCVSDEVSRMALMDHLITGIEAAIELDMYVIVDWHILSDGNPNTYKQEAISFFEYIASSYGSRPNIIYEICNEPNGNTTWEDIKLYAVDVIDCIRYYSPDSLIIVGTPNWSQDVDTAALSPINRSNLLYSLHFYSATHKDELRSKLESAVNNGLPVIVSEFGVSEASGNGIIDTDSADIWMSMLDYYNIGYVFWNLSNKDESCALFVPSCIDLYDWTEEDYSAAGKWFETSQQRFINDSAFTYTPGSGSLSEVPTTIYSSGDCWSFSNNCNVTVSCSSTWSDDSWQYASYDVTIFNTGSSDLSGWRLRFTWNSDITPKEYWSCDLGGSGSNRLFVPAEYNTTIPAGSSVNFGMIVYSTQTPVLTNVSFE